MSFSRRQYDAIVIGSGPNGLACAIALAQAGQSVVVVERSHLPGGGARTMELTQPGFLHDVCSAVHPLGLASPFFKTLPLEKHGLRWIFGGAELAHPFADGSALILKKSVQETAEQLGRDQKAFARIFTPLVSKFDQLAKDILAPPLHFPLRGSKSSLSFANFGLKALLPAETFTRLSFKEPKTRALFMGSAAHSMASLTAPGSAAVGLVLQLAGLSSGWPIPQGGSQSITTALLSYFKSLGGELVTDHDVQSIDELPSHKRVYFDLTPRQILKIAGHRLPAKIVASFQEFKYGPGVFKLDWALRAPIPWTNQQCATAPTVHLGASSQEMIDAEKQVLHGKASEAPFVLLAQPSLFDSTRAPAGQHTAWAYCHVPNGFKGNQTEAIENQIERFAPGFKKIILQRHEMSPQSIEAHNPNYVGGDISGGAVNFKQLIFRPRFTLDPYSLGDPRFWICSSSTPPGPGVHGMCGALAAQASLKTL